MVKISFSSEIAHGTFFNFISIPLNLIISEFKACVWGGGCIATCSTLGSLPVERNQRRWPQYIRWIPAQRAILLKVGGVVTLGPFLRLSHSHTQTSYAGTREFIWRRTGVTCYNHLFAWSIVTRCRGVGCVFLLWGKGLMLTLSSPLFC